MASMDCDYCRYRESVGRALLPFAQSAMRVPPQEEKPVKPKAKKKDEPVEHETAQLF
jgi:hypothetical protein